MKNLFDNSILTLPRPNAPDFLLDISKLQPGTYIERFSLASEVISRKIMKQ